MDNKKSSVEWYAKQIEILHYDYFTEHISKDEKNQRLKQLLEQAKAMQKQQSEHYATFITNCVINNLPTITFNDWINLGNNE